MASAKKVMEPPHWTILIKRLTDFLDYQTYFAHFKRFLYIHILAD